MSTSDDQLTRNIRYELEHDARVDAAHLHIAVTEGVAVLSGSAPNLAARQAAKAAAGRVGGLRRIFDAIAIDEALVPPSDAEIANRVQAILRLDAAIPADAIAVEVQNRVVTLLGTVDWPYQREAARSAAARIAGVARVGDRIKVSGPPSVADLRGRILAALERLVETEAAALEIEVRDGVVRLTGTLDGAAARAAAEEAAKAAPGVIEIRNNLRAPEVADAA